MKHERPFTPTTFGLDAEDERRERTRRRRLMPRIRRLQRGRKQEVAATA